MRVRITMQQVKRGIFLLLVGIQSLCMASCGEGIKVDFIPYFWAVNLDGKVQVGSLPTTDIHLNFNQVMRQFHGGGAAFAVARKDNLVGFFDFTYLNLKKTHRGPTLSAALDLKSTLATAAVGYHLNLCIPFSIDLFAGARYFKMDNILTVNGRGSASKTVSWVDPIVGANIVFPLEGTKFALQMIADVGGFGVGSHLEWELMPLLRYSWSPNWVGYIGYRLLDVNYSETGMKYDVLTHGAIGGIGFVF